MSSPIRLFAAIALAAVALLATGCGDTVIDDAKAEDAVQQSMEGSIEEKVTSVECPSEEKVEAGKTFGCTVTFANGKTATTTLKILNDDADVKIVGFKPIAGQ
jgi:transcription elongation GreA/GreB family factor